MSAFTKFRWWLSRLVTPKWSITIFVEINHVDFGYEPVQFDDLQALVTKGSGKLYYTTDKLPYLTIFQQGEKEFREAFKLCQWRKRNDPNWKDPNWRHPDSFGTKR